MYDSCKGISVHGSGKERERERDFLKKGGWNVNWWDRRGCRVSGDRLISRWKIASRLKVENKTGGAKERDVREGNFMTVATTDSQ